MEIMRPKQAMICYKIMLRVCTYELILGLLLLLLLWDN